MSGPCSAVNPSRQDGYGGFFDGFELLEPDPVPKHQWRLVTGTADAGTVTTSARNSARDVGGLDRSSRLGPGASPQSG